MATDTLHIAPAGGRDVPFSVIPLDRLAAYAGRPSRGEGIKITNLDFESGTAGWQGLSSDLVYIDELHRAQVHRTFEGWGPKRYPDRTYPVPPVVALGFAEHVRTNPAPKVTPIFHVDPSRYSSRNGRAIDRDRMWADIDAAKRAGAILLYHTELTVPVISNIDSTRG